MKRKIFFRADAGPEIGYGHFIRTLALADMLKDDFDCVFYTQTPTDYQKKEASTVCPLVELPASDSRLELFLDMLTGDEIVVLDNYFYTTDYQKKIKEKGCQLVCIDDMHNTHYVADMVINHAMGIKKENFSIEDYTQLCLGTQFALLRRPFLDAIKKSAPKPPKSTIERIAICFGGSDPFHLTEKALEDLLPGPSLQHIDVIVGTHFKSFGKYNDPRIHFHQSISAQEVANIFSSCDLAIVSASSVCLEALACGAMLAVGWYVDNQHEGYEILNATGWVVGLGDLTKTSFKPLTSNAITQKPITIHWSDIRQNFINAFNSLK